MNYSHVIENIPDYQEFLTVAELDASSKELASCYPEQVELFSIGTSREGHPILCLKIGNGPKHALVFACPHPNEPIGAMTVEYLSRVLASQPEFTEKTGYTWYLIKCVDPDGTKRNEGWFKGPFTLRNYAEHYYRPAMDEQVEWTFPIDYKELHFHAPIPETQALMKLIEEVRPEFMYSLHNAGFGGVFWYISKNRPDIYRRFAGIPKKYGLPLSLGEPEMACCIPYAPAVYQMLSTEDLYDYYETYVCADPSKLIGSGASSDSYANRVGNTLTLVCELPYFYNPQVEDETLSETITRKEAILKNMETAQRCSAFLREEMDRIAEYIPEENPYRRMIYNITAMLGQEAAAKMAEIEQNPQLDRPARQCEIFDNGPGNTFNWMTFTGLLPHMIAEEREKKGTLPEALEQAYEAGEKKLDELEQEIASQVDYEIIPICKLVAIQLECAFTVLEQLQQRPV